MRINWNIFKGVLLLGLVVFLYAFSSHKNNRRPVSKIAVQFTGVRTFILLQKWLINC